MNAAEFNEIYEATVVTPLAREGFRRHRSNAYLVADDAVLALLRFQGKFDALLQATNLLVCVRHTKKKQRSR